MKSSKEVISSTASIIDSSSGAKEELLINTLYNEDKYQYLSREFSSDLVKMYNQKNYTVDGLQDDNQLWWFNLLNKVNKTILKPFTNNNSVLNEIVLPKYMEALDKVLYYANELKEEEDKKQNKDSQDDKESKPSPKLSLNGLSKNPKPQEVDDNSQPKLKGEDLEKFIKEKVEEAEKEIKQEMEQLPQETLQGGGSAGDDSNIVSTKSGRDKIQQLHRKLRFNKSAINKIIKKTINKFQNSFRTNASKEMIEFFDAEELDDLQDLYNFGLHPYFFKDVYTEEEKFGLTVDAFFDVSGSINRTRKFI